MKARYYLCLAVILTSCFSEDTLKLPFQSYAPTTTSDGWIISTPEAEHIDRAALDNAYEKVFSKTDFKQILSLTVIRNGKLVSEAYCRDEIDRTRPNAIWSCTKSFTSMLTGIAIEEGKITSVDDSIQKYLASYIKAHPDKSSITIRDLLTMRAGINYENDGIEGQTDKLLRELPDDCVDFILSQPLVDTPGTAFRYNDGLPILMSAIIQQQVGRSMAQYASEKLFAPLGITNYKWDNYKDGTTIGAFGLWMTPRDLAKVGWMVCDSGRWNNKQIVPQQWLEQSTSVQALSSWNPYGFYWWINKNYDCFYMSGHGGQNVFIVPSKHLVVVITAEPFTQDDFQLSIEKANELLIDISEGCQ